MSSGQNLSGPLEHVAVSYRGPFVRLRSMRRVPLDQAFGQLTAYLDLILDEPQTVRGLHDVASELHDVPDLAAVLPHILGEAMSLMGAERGNIQLRDPSDGSLVLVTQSGFGAEFLDQFAVVDDGRSVCGRAARHCAQAVAPDVRDDPDFASHLSVFRTAGVRAVQSTPLLDHAGHMIGMISTHWPQPGQPPDRALRLMGFYGQLAGEVIARRLTQAAFRDDPVIAGLTITVLAPPDPGTTSHLPAIDQFMADMVNRIFAAGLSFASAEPLIRSKAAVHRLRAGIDELDDIIRALQLARLGLVTSRDRELGRHLAVAPQSVD